MAKEKNDLASLVKNITLGVVGLGAIAAITLSKGGDTYQNVVGSSVGNDIKGSNQVMTITAPTQAVDQYQNQAKDAYQLKQSAVVGDSIQYKQLIE